MAIEKKTKKQDVAPKAEETVFETLHTENEEVFETVAQGEIKPEPVESVPLSVVQKMMEEMQQKFMNQINKLKFDKNKSELDGDLEYVKDLEDDWMETPAIFFAFSLNFSIHGDKKRGTETFPPQGPIRFNPLIRTKRKGQRGVQVISVSSVKVHSKEVAEYLRGHSQYGIAFYENMGSALNVDSTWAQKMIEAQQSISRLSDLQVVARAKQEGISVSQSPEAMRKQLVEITAKRQTAQQDNMLYGSIRKATYDNTGREIIEKTIPNY